MLTLASGGSGSVKASAVSTATWADWMRSASATADFGSVNEVAKRFGGAESLLWRKTLQSAFMRLSALNDHTPPTALQSLVFGWLLPKAELSELGADRLPPDLKDGLVDSREPDPRIARVVARLVSRSDAT